MVPKCDVDTAPNVHWQEVEPSCYEHSGGRWRITPCWTGYGFELFERRGGVKSGWSVLLAFDDFDSAAAYVERR